MFSNRVPHMLDNDYTPYSAVDIFVKDLVRTISNSFIPSLLIFIFPSVDDLQNKFDRELLIMKERPLKYL